MNESKIDMVSGWKGWRIGQGGDQVSIECWMLFIILKSEMFNGCMRFVAYVLLWFLVLAMCKRIDIHTCTCCDTGQGLNRDRNK